MSVVIEARIVDGVFISIFTARIRIVRSPRKIHLVTLRDFILLINVLFRYFSLNSILLLFLFFGCNWVSSHEPWMKPFGYIEVDFFPIPVISIPVSTLPLLVHKSSLEEFSFRSPLVTDIFPIAFFNFKYSINWSIKILNENIRCMLFLNTPQYFHCCCYFHQHCSRSQVPCYFATSLSRHRYFHSPSFSPCTSFDVRASFGTIPEWLVCSGRWFARCVRDLVRLGSTRRRSSPAALEAALRWMLCELVCFSIWSFLFVKILDLNFILQT